MQSEKYLESKLLSFALFGFIFVLYAIVYMTKSMFSSAMATIVEQGIMTKSQTGLINGAFWAVYAVFQVIGGFAVDKHSPYKLVVLGLCGAAVANLIVYFNQSYSVIMVAWIFNAMVQFGIWPGIFKILSTQLNPETRGTAVFWILLSSSLGLGFSMLIASFVSHWKQNFLVSVVSLLTVAVLFGIFYKFLDKKMVKRFVENDGITEKIASQKTALLPLMVSSGLIVFVIVSFLRGAIDNGIKMMTPVLLMESYAQLPAAISTRISSVLVIFAALGALLAGVVQTKITRNESKAQILLYFASVIPLIFVCYVGNISYIWILCSLSCALTLIHGATPFSQSYVALHFKNHGKIGTVAGILNAAAGVGNIVASYVFARMAEIMPWSLVTLSWLISIIFCGVLSILVMPRWTRFIKD